MNATLFLLEEISRMVFDSSLFPLLALSREGLEEGCWWSFLTHAFLHGNLLHLLVNMVALWFTGPVLEEMLGGVRYLLLYLSGAVAGGVIQTYSSPPECRSGGRLGGGVRASGRIRNPLAETADHGADLFRDPHPHEGRYAGVVGCGDVLLCLDPRNRAGDRSLAHLGGGIAGFLICRWYRRRGVVRSPWASPPPLPVENP